MVADRGGATLSPPPSPRTAPTARSAWRHHWPLSLLFLGLPLWWALGLMTILPMVMSLVMARDLLRQRRIVLPRGFAVWCIFLVWVLLGALVLWVDAPGAAPGGGASRFLVFLSRVAWYVASTVAMLWVANRRESELSTRWLFQLLAFLFVVTTAGGYLGLLAPTLEFRSAVEYLLPAGVRANALVKSMVHPQAAEIQAVLGTPAPRPQAPFPFANTWGSVMALSLPFFLVAWVKQGRRWQQVSAPVVLLLASVPIVYSLNRGLWLCLAAGALGLVVIQLFRRRVAPLLVTVAVLVALGGAFVVSPLGNVYQERLAHQHSNERRSELLTQTVKSTVEGSPFVGFGSTRDVQGNFLSIAGGSTPSCKACGVPALGTQGQLWLVIFSQGLVGLALFLLFFGICAARCWRCRSSTETVCTFILLFYAIQLSVYDTLNLPFFVIMLTIGVTLREQRSRPDATAPYTATAALVRLRDVAPLVALCMLVGAVAGGVWSRVAPITYTSTVAVLLNEVPVQLESASINAPSRKRQEVTSIDTEAALVVANRTLRDAVPRTSAADVRDLRGRIQITAPPQADVLRITVTAATARGANDVAARVANAYLANRREELVKRRRDALTEARRQVATLERGSSYIRGDELILQQGLLGKSSTVSLASLQAKITGLMLTPVDAGDVLRERPARKVRSQREVAVTSGAALGLLVAAAVSAARPDWRPRRRLRRRGRHT